MTRFCNFKRLQTILIREHKGKMDKQFMKQVVTIGLKSPGLALLASSYDLLNESLTQAFCRHELMCSLMSLYLTQVMTRVEKNMERKNMLCDPSKKTYLYISALMKPDRFKL